ncbi:M16 family metallopeptidase [Limihaloglobus sulfuriphilus]|nr:pitrilysin family protein [Limihaloglobus sulfuriphilus]
MLLAVPLCFGMDNHSLSLPQCSQYTLDNGLRVMLLEHREQPAVSFRMLVNAGTLDEPQGKEGTAVITARSLLQGCETMNAEETADMLSAIAARFNITVRAPYTSLELDALTAAADTGFNILADIILTPRFASEGIRRVKREQRAMLEYEMLDNHTIAAKHARRLLFGENHPLGRPATAASLGGISASDAKSYWQRYYRPNNCTLIIIGDYDKEKMISLIKTRFAGRQSGNIQRRRHTPPGLTHRGRLLLVDKPGMTQAVIHMLSPAPGSGSDDRWAFATLDYTLGGGGFSSRLMSAVRSEGGRAYAVWSSYQNAPDFGLLSITTSTQNETAAATYSQITGQIESLSRDGITTAELNAAKSHKIGEIPLRLESPADIANLLLRYEANYPGRGYDELSGILERYRQLTREEVNRAAGKYIDPARFDVVILCDLDKIRGQFESRYEFEEIKFTKGI